MLSYCVVTDSNYRRDQRSAGSWPALDIVYIFSSVIFLSSDLGGHNDALN